MSGIISAVSSAVRSVGSYLGFYTTGPNVATTTTTDGVATTVTTTGVGSDYVTPATVFKRTFVARIRLGNDAVPANGSTAAIAASAPPSFSSFRLASLEFNPPLTSVSVSRITSVTLFAPPSPHDVNWSVGIWCHLDPVGRTYDAVERRSPNYKFVWRSNVTVQPIVEHVIPWPSGFPVMDSLHAVLPGLHSPAIQFGCRNGPPGTATALPPGAYDFLISIECDVGGQGMIGTI